MSAVTNLVRNQIFSEKFTDEEISELATRVAILALENISIDLVGYRCVFSQNGEAVAQIYEQRSQIFSLMCPAVKDKIKSGELQGVELSLIRQQRPDLLPRMYFDSALSQKISSADSWKITLSCSGEGPLANFDFKQFIDGEEIPEKRYRISLSNLASQNRGSIVRIISRESR